MSERDPDQFSQSVVARLVRVSMALLLGLLPFGAVAEAFVGDISGASFGTHMDFTLYSLTGAPVQSRSAGGPLILRANTSDTLSAGRAHGSASASADAVRPSLKVRTAATGGPAIVVTNEFWDSARLFGTCPLSADPTDLAPCVEFRWAVGGRVMASGSGGLIGFVNVHFEPYVNRGFEPPWGGGALGIAGQPFNESAFCGYDSRGNAVNPCSKGVSRSGSFLLSEAGFFSGAFRDGSTVGWGAFLQMNTASVGIDPASPFDSEGEAVFDDGRDGVHMVILSRHPDTRIELTAAGSASGKGWLQEFARWEATHCPPFVPGNVPLTTPTVAFLPARARGASSALTFDQVVERIEYIEEYYYQQSLCSVRIKPFIVRDPGTDGWLDLPRTQAEYEAIPNEFGSRATIIRNLSIGADAFEVASLKDLVFLANQQLGYIDAVMVIVAPSIELTAFGLARGIVTDPDVRALTGGVGGLVAAALIGGECLISGATIGTCFGADLGRASFLLSLQETLFKQGFSIAPINEPTSVWTHELGHGLFTFWDYYGAPEPFVRGDVGPWDLMGGGGNREPPGPVSAYNKAIQGWVTFREIRAGDWGPDVVVPLADLRFGAEVPRYKPPREGFYDWYIFELRTPADDVPDVPEDLIVVGTSPFTYTNHESSDVRIRIHGGTLLGTTLIGFGGVETFLGAVRTVELAPAQGVRVEFTGRPTIGKLSLKGIDGRLPEIGQAGVVVYGKRETRTVGGLGIIPERIPSCGIGTLHGLPMFFLDRLLVGLHTIPIFNPEFGSCLFKVGDLDHFTLVPGGAAHLDDDAGVEFSLSPDFVLSIRESPRSRTVVRMETSADIGFGGLPGTVIGTIDKTLPVDLRVVAADGRSVRRNHSTGVYELEIPGARAGDVHTPHQWISFPDDVPAFFVVDASEAATRARALGVQSLDIEAIVSIIHYDASGAVSELQAPVVFMLSLDQPTTSPTGIPLAVARDTTPPTTTATATPARNSNGWNNTDVVVALSAVDDAGGSGVNKISFALSGSQTGDGAVAGSGTSVTISAEGVTTLTYFATDNAGNRETAKTLVVQIDRTPPEPPVVSVTPAPNADGWNNGPVTVSFAGNGDVGPVQSGGVTCSGSTTLTAETAGTVVSGTCTDAAGNASSARSITVKIDQTPPSVACSVDPTILWPPNDKLVSVTVSVTVSDVLSGPAGFTLVSVTSDASDGGRGHHARHLDIQGFAVGTPDTSGLLRAERSEHGATRVYTLTYRGLDRAGNVGTCSATVTVPHDRRGRQEHDEREQDQK